MDIDTAEFPTRSSMPRAAPLLAVVALVCTGMAGAFLGGSDPTGVDAALGRPQVTVTSGSYEPGQSSGWHVHPGVHSVVVLTGTLTVYDERCGREDFGPGEAYLGGDRPHLVRNDTAGQVTYVVTHAGGPGSEPALPSAPCDLR